MIGVYSITNCVNGKVYIGQSWDIETRFRDYKGYRAGAHLSAAFKKYGIHAFHFGIVEVFPPTVSQAALDVAEDEYIVAGGRLDQANGYNMRRGGSHGKHGAESRRRISEIQIGRKLSEEHKRKIGEKSKGRYYSAETRAKIGAAHTGMVFSEESRRKMRESHLGKKLSRESIEKRTRTRQANGWFTAEHKQSISEAKKGKPWSDGRRAAYERSRMIANG